MLAVVPKRGEPVREGLRPYDADPRSRENGVDGFVGEDGLKPGAGPVGVVGRDGLEGCSSRGFSGSD